MPSRDIISTGHFCLLNFHTLQLLDLINLLSRIMLSSQLHKSIAIDDNISLMVNGGDHQSIIFRDTEVITRIKYRHRVMLKRTIYDCKYIYILFGIARYFYTRIHCCMFPYRSDYIFTLLLGALHFDLLRSTPIRDSR